MWPAQKPDTAHLYGAAVAPVESDPAVSTTFAMSRLWEGEPKGVTAPVKSVSEKVDTYEPLAPALPPQYPDSDSVLASALDGYRWSRFTETTTFHGLRYVFNSRGHFVRRSLWCLFVLGAAALFFVQIWLRFDAYFKYHTTQDIQVKYEPRIALPTITICNQNLHRLLPTIQYNVYSVMDDLYRKKLTMNKVNTAALSNLTDAAELEAALAHPVLTLMTQCTWHGRPCNVTEEFEAVSTDFGLCYSYNSRGDKRVSSAGVSGGLTLLINLEQFEYTPGPHSDAGVKILLHDSLDYPLVKDLGFSVAPGTHTLVSVRRVEVTRLVQPFGVCDAETLTYSDCVTQCRARALLATCGCIAHYMTGVLRMRNVTLCDSAQHLACVLRDDMVTQDGCNCSFPCRRTEYDQRLSHTQLSTVNLETLVAPDAAARADLLQRHRVAREANSLVQENARSRDVSEIRAVLAAIDSAYTSARRTHGLFSDPARLARTLNVNNILVYDTAALEKDASLVRAALSQPSSRYNFAWRAKDIYRLYRPDRFWYYVKTGLKINWTKQSSRLLITLKRTKAKKQKCRTDWPIFEILLYSLLVDKKARAQLQNYEQTYTSDVEMIFNNTGVPPASVADHAKCLLAMKKTNFSAEIDLINTTDALVSTYKKQTKCTKMIKLVREILKVVLKHENISSALSPCGWMERTADSYHLALDGTHSGTGSDVTAARKVVSELRAALAAAHTVSVYMNKTQIGRAHV